MESLNFSEFLSQLTSGFTQVLDVNLKEEDYIVIDLSENNIELGKVDVSSSRAFSNYIAEYLNSFGKKVAFGGYSEVRKLYRRSELFTASEDEDSNRNIHLGLDFWANAHTDVLAVLDGKIHSFNDNSNFGDYGPTIIIEHSFQEKKFYSLYGHLSRASLENLKPEMPIKKGEKIGELGTAEENGDYAPHLHFQIIEDLDEKIGDFPGVTSRKDLDFYLQNCPDPNYLIKLRKV
ncbi:peptidoglycan DD-metalloendopeptidase family protein [Salegentibacter maritimus]|uniref:Peptidoglycan DD-metalloendopeptidase family protein n=1 Tax=Salegentibacter maritimus TaxID=2794347 RepID=A0ABS0TG46_9FLAO|nr:peptidoglycan DD-metalloendopeptidase family protein [Salegentibacter maritimus]MBI6120028.1 peptidoglycan DD-metalloendopeptidase family protein [Salegentibacter maritimus]